MPIRRRSTISSGKALKPNSEGANTQGNAKQLPKSHSPNPTNRGQFEIKLETFGMQGLSYLLGGGFPNDSVYLLTGEPGSFYSTFAQQALYSAVKNGQKVVYYTTEMSSVDVQQDMAVFKWDIQDEMDNGNWIFTRLIPPQLKAIVNNTPDDPREQRIDLLTNSLSSVEEDYLERMEESRWSAISLSYLMRCYPMQEITDLVMFLTNAAHRLGGVHFLLLPGGVHGESEVNHIKSIVDGVLSFKFAQGFEQAEGEIEIQKMRRIIPRVKIVRHAVEDNGIQIETTARVG